LRFTPSKPLKRARQLRDNQTEAETRLWGCLRSKRLHGWKFNRQVPIGSYIVDFLCEQAKLIVEVDGSTHGDAHEIKYDEKRTVYLQSLGHRVFRCYNADVFENLNGVLDGILLKLNGP
jgi:very-short-patch-repair endonuclease